MPHLETTSKCLMKWYRFPSVWTKPTSIVNKGTTRSEGLTSSVHYAYLPVNLQQSSRRCYCSEYFCKAFYSPPPPFPFGTLSVRTFLSHGPNVDPLTLCKTQELVHRLLFYFPFVRQITLQWPRAIHYGARDGMQPIRGEWKLYQSWDPFCYRDVSF
jgi:hypothetical protein